MKAKNEHLHNIKHDHREVKQDKPKKIRELSDDFDFMDEWDATDLSDIPGHYGDRFE